MIVTYFLIDNIRVNWYFKKTLGFILFNEVTWLENHCLARQRSVAHPDCGVKRKHCMLIQFVCSYIIVFSNNNYFDVVICTTTTTLLCKIIFSLVQCDLTLQIVTIHYKF